MHYNLLVYLQLYYVMPSHESHIPKKSNRLNQILDSNPVLSMYRTAGDG